MTPELSVVVPALDAEATIAEQLDALLAEEWDRPFEVIVVDNGSTDGTRDVVERYHSRDARVRLVDGSDQRGVAHARNVGLCAAHGPSVAFCDADDVVARGWVRAMGDALRGHEYVTGPLEVDRLNPPWLTESRGRAPEHRAGDFAGVFLFAHGCNLGVRRDVVARVGPFDQRYLPGEDVEFAFRLWRVGITPSFVEDAAVHYRYRPSVAAVYRQARAYARVQPRLVAMVRRAGFDVPPGRELRGLVWLVRNLGALWSRERRPRWLFVAGGRLGTLEGRLAVLGETLRRRRREGAAAHS
ncbi:MAG TPA: glycosyltransferase [Acidimicrobiia bacterium]